MDLSYIINELGENREDYFNAVTPPLVQSTNFSFPSVAAMREALKDEGNVPFYTRGSNPTIDLLRKKMAALEGTEDSLAFASGSGAMAAAVMSQVNSGDHIICVQKPYGWTNKLLNILLPRFGVQTTMVDGTDALNYEKAIQPNTKLLILESPNSFTFELQDVVAVTAIARKYGLVTIMDNSCASPLNQSPVSMGVDMVVHSATKYLGGHSDSVAGVVCGPKQLIQKIFASEFMTLGAVISPFNAWLLLRGLRTLSLRIDRAAQSTLPIAQFLENHSKIAKVYYPFLASHPQYELARRQMRQGGGQLTIELKSNSLSDTELFCDSLKRFLIATSWGGYESLIYPSAVLVSSANYDSPNLNWKLIRLYIGLEDPTILMDDLEQALAKVGP